MIKIVCVCFLGSVLLACKQQVSYQPVQGKWIQGSAKEKLKTIESQFRGFDKTMVEVGYRYQELYWAGQDENWEYANYQLSKIKKAIVLGLQRRPKRRTSAENFLNYVVPEVKKAVKKGDKQLFMSNFQMLRINCNNCHQAERVPTFTVQIPTRRVSPIRTKP